MPAAIRDIADLINGGESEAVEFKETLRGHRQDKKPEQAVLKAIAGFLNTYGGDVIIGLKDDGSPIGILRESFFDGEDTTTGRDNAGRFLSAIARERIDENISDAIRPTFIEYKGALLLVIHCKSVGEHALFPVWVQDVGSKVQRFYRRGSKETIELHGGDMLSYINYVNEFKTPPVSEDDG